MNNYRVTFLHSLDKDTSFYNKNQAECSINFKDLVIYYPIILEIINVAKEKYSIKHIWWFFEPHIEITWLDNINENYKFLVHDIEDILRKYNIKDAVFKSPISGNFAEWYSTGADEELFGAKRYSICSEWILNYLQYKDAVDKGKTLRKQVERTIHGLCNPLGFNYVDEAKICFSRGLICILFRYFSFNRAVWIYRNIFRQVY